MFPTERGKACWRFLVPAPLGGTERNRRLVGRAGAELEFARADELAAGLPQQLGQLERAGREAHEAIAERFFHASTAIRWSA